MKAFATRLLDRQTVASGTLAFHLEKPAGFTFRAGQAIDLLLPGSEQDATADHQRTLSIVSAPHESEIVVATRMRDSAFKRSLGALQPGAGLQFAGPFGSLTLHKHADREAVFIAGGIGITPFMSMLRDVARTDGMRRILLVYANREPPRAAYLEELRALDASLPGFALVATMTGLPGGDDHWKGETRRLDAALLGECCDGLSAPIHYIVGPPAMTADVREALLAIGAEEDDIRSEDFFGY